MVGQCLQNGCCHGLLIPFEVPSSAKPHPLDVTFTYQCNRPPWISTVSSPSCLSSLCKVVACTIEDSHKDVPRGQAQKD
ncbi:hypothetical protein Y1Q_0022526 [Alligator mississippiensis]|uniref:Uncharacterized protein n=1 Tax=Alligator mississippiensis TaxID=8496 RepID=A0A151NWH3_ALLMI|nr:hypothetical protein Y1Q_0022526 [Alligator mississippiensis]